MLVLILNISFENIVCRRPKYRSGFVLLRFVLGMTYLWVFHMQYSTILIVFDEFLWKFNWVTCSQYHSAWRKWKKCIFQNNKPDQEPNMWPMLSNSWDSCAYGQNWILDMLFKYALSHFIMVVKILKSDIPKQSYAHLTFGYWKSWNGEVSLKFGVYHWVNFQSGQK